MLDKANRLDSLLIKCSEVLICYNGSVGTVIVLNSLCFKLCLLVLVKPLDHCAIFGKEKYHKAAPLCFLSRLLLGLISEATIMLSTARQSTCLAVVPC